jgi:uncharacterized cupredoxin-like copper-binding protein
MKGPSVLAASILVATVMLAGCGLGRSATGAGPVEVRVSASEFRFAASQTTFTVGTPYHFVLTNAGLEGHDWMIMPRGEQDESKKLIGVEDDQFGPRASVTRDFTFASSGSYEMACHVSGHYEAGMVLPIVVN